MSTDTSPLEVLAPAGDPASLRAALDAGADAVYLGLSDLNARRRARNFSAEELAGAVAQAHVSGAKVYLTLNTDVAERELSLAARCLEVARAAGVDAVLVRDPALLALKPCYPELSFHFSTQAGAACSADVEAARALGISRVVLARELSLPEIAAASAVPGVETEVFVQGALCFSVSGRCLMSSWVGGRSGNRGQCTSPCRVPWTADHQPVGTPLSMHDLSAVDRLEELARTGVRALKIEGRLKTPSWVGQAVSLYRRALAAPGSAPGLREAAEPLGAYTGRELTSGYLDGDRKNMTGGSGRERSAAPGEVEPREAAGPEGYALRLEVASDGITCTWSLDGAAETWRLPRTEVRRAHKALALGDLLEALAAQPVAGVRGARVSTNEPGLLVPPRVANALQDQVALLVRRARKSRRLTPVALSAAARDTLRENPVSSSNRLVLGDRPDRARLEARHLEGFLGQVQPRGGVVVEGLDAAGLAEVRAARARCPVTVALPPVLFEPDLPAVHALLEACRALSVAVEVNTWGGWWLARQAGVKAHGGPGLGVLNSLAARALGDLGLQSVTLSVEADRSQLEDVAARCGIPCSLVVLGRPPLMVTRVELEDAVGGGRVLEDRRGTRVRARREGGTWVLRPVDPFDLRDLHNRQIRVAHLVADLVGSPDPVAEWEDAARRDKPLRFNHERSLA
jgi:putative protease